MRKLTHQELLKRQSSCAEQRLPVTVILNNVRSLYNVGSIFRTADATGIEKIWLCGITGTPDSIGHGKSKKSEVRSPKTRIAKTALGAERTVPWEYRENVISIVKELKSQDYEIVLLEQIKGSTPYQEFEPRRPVCLVLGNEISGVSDELLALSDRAIEIEMAGLKNSLNVTVAFGIAAYHVRNCLRPSLRGGRKTDEAISGIASASF